MVKAVLASCLALVPGAKLTRPLNHESIVIPCASAWPSLLGRREGDVIRDGFSHRASCGVVSSELTGAQGPFRSAFFHKKRGINKKQKNPVWPNVK